VSPDGATVFVTGYSYDPNTSYDYATVAYDAASGTQRWVARYNGPGNGNDFATALAVSPGGGSVFVTGYSYDPNTSYDYATVAYDAASGAQQWVAQYKGPGNGDDVAYGLAVSRGGATVFVTGYTSRSNSSKDYATVAYDAASGTQRWVARYNGPGNGDDVAYAVAVGPGGASVFVTGYDWSGTSYDYATVAYDAATGTQRWAARYNGPGNVDDVATAVGAAPDGATVFVTGYSAGSNTSLDYATVAYDAATGTERWLARYNGPGNGDDGAYALGVGRGGTVFVTGYSSASRTSPDYATVAYDAATGAQRGSARIGPGSATALVISPDGTALFVTGSVGTPISDYGTVAYSLIP